MQGKSSQNLNYEVTKKNNFKSLNPQIPKFPNS